MIAAALEDESYPLDELVRHLANLRGGHRFVDTGGGSGRLAFAARSAYGHVDLDGYLHAGLSLGFGEGTWEAIERYQSKGLASLGDGGISRGDVERAILEWRSLLRHIVHAPDPDAPRWEDFRQAARECLSGYAKTPEPLPALPAPWNRPVAARTATFFR